MTVEAAVERDDVIDADDRRRPKVSGRGREALLVAVTWFVGQLVFFRDQWFSGFDRIMGDTGDARLIIYLHENWYQSLLGHASWRDPAFYYPLKDTLGLSDTFLLWQVVYAPLRALGADPFLAFQLVLIVLSALGFATFYLVCRTLWHPPVWVGLLCATIFTFSNALFANSNHAQLYGVLLVPLVALLGIASWRVLPSRRLLGICLGAGFGALSVLVVYSTYYVGYLSVLGTAIAALLTVLTAPRATFRSVAAFLQHRWHVLVGAVVGAVPPALLFAYTYESALRATGGYKLATAEYFAPRLSDLVNVGSGNLLWGSLLVHHVVNGVAAQGERDYAVTPLLLVVCVLGAVFVTVHERRRTSPPGPHHSAAVLAATGIVMVLAPMVVGSTFLWQAFYWIPGASGIRAVDRIGVVACGVFALALANVSVRALPWLRQHLHGAALVAVCAVVAGALCVEQVNIADGSQISGGQQVSLLDSMPQPPSGCSSFFVESATGSPAHPERVQTTAMLLSERFGIPTLNGTSGSFPTGWNLYEVTKPNYLAAVARWVALEHVTSPVCGLDLDTRSWHTFSSS